MKIAGLLLFAKEVLLTILSVSVGVVSSQAANSEVYTLTNQVHVSNTEVSESQESEILQVNSEIELEVSDPEMSSITIVFSLDTLTLDGDIEVAEEAEAIFDSLEVYAYYDQQLVEEDIINRDQVEKVVGESSAVFTDGAIILEVEGLGTEEVRSIYVKDTEYGLEATATLAVEYETEEATTSSSGTYYSSSKSSSSSSKTIDWETYKASWQANYAINSDYIGKIVFASGLISEHFVQYYNSSNLNQGYYQYVRLNWKTKAYDSEGTVFIDSYANVASSMNFVIYGHYVYGTNHKFTPLAKLLSASNYSANSIFYLYLEDEIRVYQIAHVYLAQLYSSNGTDYDSVLAGMEFMKNYWTEDQFNYYISEVKKIEQYNTGVTINYGNKFITLQTCVAGRDDQRQIVIAKQISTIKYGTETNLLIDLTK